MTDSMNKNVTRGEFQILKDSVEGIKSIRNLSVFTIIPVTVTIAGAMIWGYTDVKSSITLLIEMDKIKNDRLSRIEKMIIDDCINCKNEIKKYRQQYNNEAATSK